ncbi:MAG TPA: hypothetical protein VGW75_15055 [Solirubrobacteraceae bacterium]|jgi:hypothetical protein|nr:hypothetical protein [Solirubrobacteraceae bacterium]
MVTTTLMLNVRIYRSAFAGLLVAVVVVAFSLADRPRPIGTTLAPDAFDGRRALRVVDELLADPRGTFRDRRPGTLGDDALAARVERELSGAGFDTSSRVSAGETIDGEAALTTVIGERAGRNPRQIVVVAERDAAEPGSPGRLSATAALIELARVFEGRATRRTLTLVSTSGGSGGVAGARQLARELGSASAPVDAAIVLGDMGSDSEYDLPVVVPWAEHGGIAPLRLRRTVENAVELETDVEHPGSPRALAQFARQAVPLSLTGQGPLGAEGVAAVTLSVTGERAPAATARVSRARLQAFGRAALRSISALDNGPDVPAGPREYVVFQQRVLPSWAIRLLGATLLFPLLLAAVDGLARVRRRRSPVLPWLLWIATAAVPFLLAALVARVLGLTGVLPAPPGAVDPEALPVDAAGLAALGVVLALGLLLRRPLGRLAGAGTARDARADPGGPAAALAVVLAALGTAVWAVNPYTALLLAPALHLWMLAATPEVRVPRGVALALVALGLLPFALVGAHYAEQLGLDPVELAWEAALLVSGGYAGPLGIVAWSLVLACGLLAAAVAAGKRRRRAAVDEPPAVRTRGPLSYAGPGSLGGTESALRR